VTDQEQIHNGKPHDVRLQRGTDWPVFFTKSARCQLATALGMPLAVFL